MASCGHEVQFFSVPPSYDWLITTFPYLTANKRLNRSISRCRLCDLVAAQQRAESAECSQTVEEIEKLLQLTKELVEQDIRKEKLEETLSVMLKQRDAAIAAVNKGIIDAWRQYWSVWGLDEKQNYAHTDENMTEVDEQPPTASPKPKLTAAVSAEDTSRPERKTEGRICKKSYSKSRKSPSKRGR